MDTHESEYAEEVPSLRKQHQTKCGFYWELSIIFLNWLTLACSLVVMLLTI